MGSFDPLKVNQPIELELPGDELHRYRSKVEELTGDRVVVMSPMKGGCVITLKPGTQIKIIYRDNIAVYTYLSRVITQNNDHVSTVTLAQPTEIRRIQRRNFVRLDTRLKVKLVKLDAKFNPKSEEFSATTVDISGGGLMFNCSVRLEPGEVLQASLCLNPNETVRAIGRVVRSLENPPGVRETYSVGFEFTVIDEIERDKIIRFIFNQQRELRRKGLL
ncbi:MAG: hypothetical protein CVU89_12015 [Firmicutes bacterium HGW-Firmicutes-14]|nr:MAG: hypothetical protein CVU89_12015 [Firmicutes bacterium HGW-Firmicutes-14]